MIASHSVGTDEGIGMSGVAGGLTVERDRIVAYGLLRGVLGLNIAMHGIARIYSGPVAFALATVPTFAKTPLPSWAVYAFSVSIPFIETIAGLLVLVGLATRSALIFGIVFIAALTFGSTLKQDWQAAGAQLTYALLYALLIAFLEYNTLSLDGLRRR